MQTRQKISRIFVLAALCAMAGTSYAQGYWQGPEGGPGYGPGYGRHMGPGYGPQGYGPQGLGPQGYGPGAGMGPGMMGGSSGRMGPGYGPQGGPGMMQGRHGFGPGEGMGMAGGRWERMAGVLGLNEDQRTKVARIFEDTRRKNWDVIGQIQSERFKLRELMRGDKVDPNAAVAQKKKVDELKQQVLRARLEARNQVFALLTPEQREKANSLGQRWGGRGRG